MKAGGLTGCNGRGVDLHLAIDAYTDAASRTDGAEIDASIYSGFLTDFCAYFSNTDVDTK